MADVTEHLGQVAPRLALDQDRGHEHLQVQTGHALVEVHQRGAHVHPQPLLLVELRELGAQRLRHLLAHELHRSLKGVARPHGVDEHVDRLGQLGLELLQPLTLLSSDEKVRCRDPYGRTGQRREWVEEDVS
jgi:hypothetical protein